MLIGGRGRIEETTKTASKPVGFSACKPLCPPAFIHSIPFPKNRFLFCIFLFNFLPFPYLSAKVCFLPHTDMVAIRPIGVWICLFLLLISLLNGSTSSMPTTTKNARHRTQSNSNLIREWIMNSKEDMEWKWRWKIGGLAERMDNGHNSNHTHWLILLLQAERIPSSFATRPKNARVESVAEAANAWVSAARASELSGKRQKVRKVMKEMHCIVPMSSVCTVPLCVLYRNVVNFF